MAMQAVPSAISPVAYSDFTVLTSTYKIVQEHEIKVDVLLPPKLKTGKAPIIVFWHGGALVSLTLTLVMESGVSFASANYLSMTRSPARATFYPSSVHG